MKPKRTLQLRHYLLLAILYPFIPAQAQKAHFGLKAGIACSNFSFRAVDPIDHTTPKLGVMFGMFVHIPLKGRFSIRPSVEYVSKGGHSGVYFFDNIQLSYLDIPINLLYEVPLKRNKLLAGGGPVVSFLLNPRLGGQGYERHDLGVNIMAGYEWAIGASLSLNYTQGLKNILINKTNGGNIQNHYFGFTIGYWF